MIYIGVDPGKGGGIVAFHADSNKVETFPIPKIGTEIDRIKLKFIFEDLKEKDPNTMVCLEEVHAIFGSAAGATFSFGHTAGLIEGVLVGLNISCVLVQPKTWQKVCFQGVSIISKLTKTGKKRNDTKAMALVAAQRLYPEVRLQKSERAKKAHDGIVDALLLMHYLKVHYGK